MNNIDKTLNKIGELYTTNLQNHGLDSKSVGWKDMDSQIMRFENLLKVVPHNEKDQPLEFLDYGCGYGAMYTYMKEQGFNVSKFYGYDISKEMLSEAAKIVPSNVWVPRCEVVVKDKVDYSIVSGTFNVMFDSSEEEWDKYIKDKVSELLEHSKKGVAFNLLTSFVDWKAKDLYYADPTKYFNFCKSLSRYVTLIHDYPLYEWTIYIRKK